MPCREEGTATGLSHPDFGEVRIREGKHSVLCPVCHGTTPQPDVFIPYPSGVSGWWLGCYHCMGRGYSFLNEQGVAELTDTPVIR